MLTLNFAISLLALIISLIIFIIIMIKLYPINSKKFELFTYDKLTQCEGQLIKKKNCFDKFNGMIYVICNWNNSKEGQYSTLYSTVSEYKNIKTINYWLSIYDENLKETIGTARWTNCQTIDDKIIKSNISAASGILQSYQNQNVLLDTRKSNAKLYLYTRNYKNIKKFLN
jgi:hypothetical protein